MPPESRRVLLLHAVGSQGGDRLKVTGELRSSPGYGGYGYRRIGVWFVVWLNVR